MKKLVWMETKHKREMQAFFCDECNALFDQLPYWSIQSSLWMHLKGSGHKAIRYLKVEEVEAGDLRMIGHTQGPTDLQLLDQGRPQPPDVTIWELR